MEQLIKDIEHWAGHREKMLILRYILTLGIPTHEAGDGTRINLSEISPENYDKIHTYAYQVITPMIEEFKQEMRE